MWLRSHDPGVRARHDEGSESVYRSDGTTCTEANARAGRTVAAESVSDPAPLIEAGWPPGNWAKSCAALFSGRQAMFFVDPLRPRRPCLKQFAAIPRRAR